MALSEQAATGAGFRAINTHENSQPLSAAAALTAGSLFASLGFTTSGQRSVSAGPATLPARSDDYDSLYDATPAPLLRPNATREGSAASDANIAVPDKQERIAAEPVMKRSSTASAQPSLAASERIRIWLTADWTAGRNVVLISSNVSVQDLYHDISKKLSRKLQGKSIAALSMSIHKLDHGTEAIDIEIDDEAGWETMLELAREAGTTELSAIVLRNDD